MQRSELLNILHAQLHLDGHIIGAAVGSGMTAKYAAMGGADLLLALSAGKYRVMGRSSFASYFCYGNNNSIVEEMGERELFPIIKDTPVIFGLMANEPELNLYEYIKKIKASGFSGIVNFPTMSLIDGQFREALEEEGNTYDKEVEAIRFASMQDLFTIAFVTNIPETEQMIDAGADVVCINLGLTKGGFLGAQKQISIDEARHMTEEIFAVCRQKNPEVIRMIYAGPANTPVDMQYIYQNTSCQGYIGGSTFDRIPTERAIFNTTRAFKSYGNFSPDDPMAKLINGEWNSHNVVEFVKSYIEKHFMDEIQLGDLATVTHVSQSYLSTKFKKDVGVSFTEYLIRYRMNKAKEFLKDFGVRCREAGEMAGYTDYAQFSKMFKKYIGYSPSEWRKMNSVRKEYP